MIIGIGLDIVEKARIENLVKSEKFIQRILTKKEQKVFTKLKENRQVEFLGGRFSAKEAFSKAIGTGIGAKCSFLDIEILANDSGKPVLVTPLLNSPVHLSITHGKEYIASQVIIEK